MASRFTTFAFLRAPWAPLFGVAGAIALVASCARTVTVVTGGTGSGGSGGDKLIVFTTNASTSGASTSGSTQAGPSTGAGTNGSGGIPKGACANDISWMYGTGLLSPADPSSSTGGGCETNQAGHATDPQCCTCITCARNTYCSKKLGTFQNNPNSAAWTACVFPNAYGSGGCPKDDPATPADEFQDCLGACNAKYPGLETAYLALLNCAACETCAYNCNAYGELAKCGAVPHPL